MARRGATIKGVSGGINGGNGYREDNVSGNAEARDMNYMHVSYNVSKMAPRHGVSLTQDIS